MRAFGLNGLRSSQEGFGTMSERNFSALQTSAIEGQRFRHSFRRSGENQTFLIRILSTVYAWQSRFSSRHHLAGLDDAALKDMGINRADVYRESTKAFWRD